MIVFISARSSLCIALLFLSAFHSLSSHLFRIYFIVGSRLVYVLYFPFSSLTITTAHELSIYACYIDSSSDWLNFFCCCAFHFLQFISMLFLRFLFRFLSPRFHHEYSLPITKKVDGNLFMSHTPLGPLKCLIPLRFPSSFYFTHSLFLFSHYLLSCTSFNLPTD